MVIAVLAAAQPRQRAPRVPLLRRVTAWCARLARVDEPALWTIAHAGRIVGVLSREGGAGRLDWFEGADARLAGYDGALTGDVGALAAALEARLGARGRVRIVAVPI